MRTVTGTALLVLACGSGDGRAKIDGAGGSKAATSAGNAGAGGVGGASSSGSGGAIPRGPTFAGADCPTDVGFSQVYRFPNVKAQVDGANVRITFDPQADAADYRVYALPKSGDITEQGIENAVFRCAGGGSVPSPAVDDENREPAPGARTRVGSNVEGYVRKAGDATLGYVFTTPGDDRIPVYAMGDSNIEADNTDCYEMRWPESRKKRFVTSEEERQELLASHFRDDGIVFYVPKPGVPDTAVVREIELQMGEWRGTLYARDAAELSARQGAGATLKDAFSVYTEAREGAEPLMRVYYGLTCAFGHDELVAGKARFQKALQQGAAPVTELHFSGLTEATTLVVEALDEKCPYQGALSPQSRPARVDPFPDSNDISYPAFMTFEQLAATSPLGELYVNGQGEDTKPKAISRACLKVEPEKPAKMDFSYDGTPETWSAGRPRNFQIWDTDTPTFDATFYAVATDQWAIGSAFGELWATYADWAADTNGKLRITPKQRATIADKSFLHVSMEVDIVSTQRRYPQLLISSADAPVQDNMKDAMTVVVQPFGGITTPVSIEVQFCDHQEWDVNNQCPKYELQKLAGDAGEFLSPRPEVTGWMGVDRTVRFDVYVASSRAYVYTNNLPYACVDLPSGKLPPGPATVTFGDVLYHSGVDLEKWYPFHLSKMHLLTTRHFSNLGFSSQVSAPTWDESRISCVPATGLKQ